MFFEYNGCAHLSYSQSSVLTLKTFLEISIKYKIMEFPFTDFSIFTSYLNTTNNVIQFFW
jgi:hypothetical protein